MWACLDIGGVSVNMAAVRPRITFALQLFALLATASSQSCPVRGQTRVVCSTHPDCQSTCATANIFINCAADCVVNGCQCPIDTFINEEMNACVRPAGCAKLRCGLPLVPGNCNFNASSLVRFFFNASSGQCQQFDFEGCESNGNNFETLRECQDICRCVLPSDSGPCEAYSEMYFYNATSGRCEMFVYGGCQGNDNRFSTMELCQQACRGDVGLSTSAVVRPQWWIVPSLLSSTVAMLVAMT